MKVYLCDTGILLSPEDPEFKIYANVYDKKHGFYDEDMTCFPDIKKAITYAKEYVKNGVDNTYAVVSEQDNTSGETLADFIEKFDVDEFDYDIENVVFSARKTDGKIEENDALDILKKAAKLIDIFPAEAKDEGVEMRNQTLKSFETYTKTNT